MATGAPGTNGVWQYGEDDSEATFSALLNKAASTTDTQIGADRTRLTALEARKLSGLVPIVPSSVNQSGGSASYNSTTGLVTFTGVTALRANGVFSSAYNYHRIIIRIKNAGSTGNYSVQAKFSASTVDSSVNYDTAAIGFLASTGGSQQLGGLNGTQFYAGRVYDNGVETMSVIDVASAGTAEYTNWTGNYIGSYPNDLQATIIGGRHRVATAYDGFYFATGGTTTGTMKVYGYN